MQYFLERGTSKEYIMNSSMISEPTLTDLQKHPLQNKNNMTYINSTFVAIQIIFYTFLHFFDPSTPGWYLPLFENWFLSLICLELLMN